MREISFMQLLIVFALLMLLGGSGDKPQISSPEVVELLKYAAGDERADEMIREVEQVSSVLEAIAPIAQAFAGAQGAKTQHVPPENGQNAANECEKDGAEDAKTPLFLQPIANIADDGIYNALARAVVQ